VSAGTVSATSKETVRSAVWGEEDDGPHILETGSTTLTGTVQCTQRARITAAHSRRLL